LALPIGTIKIGLLAVLRAEVLAASFWRGVAADDKLLLLSQLNFDPRTATATSLVKRIRSFGDQAFELELLR
jgi:hypothetical protein